MEVIYPSHDAFVEQLKTREIDLERMRPRVDWKANLGSNLAPQGRGKEAEFEVSLPSMPLRDNADYELWKLWFERIMEEIKGTPIIVGHSLGAMFIPKYYSEIVSKEPLPALLLVAPEYLTSDVPERERTNFVLGNDVLKITKSAKNITFFHSEDNPVVSFTSHAAFKRVIPDANFVSFLDKGHFNIEHFPEVVDVIKRLV